MNELKYIRKTLLKQMTCIGNGTFASVFAPNEQSATVTKVTTDRMAYYFQADQLWLSERCDAEVFFPALHEDHGDLGESRGAVAWGVEVERLVPVSDPAHRKLIREWAKTYTSAVDTSDIFPASKRCSPEALNYRSICFCESIAEKEGQFKEVFAALAYFFTYYGGAIDLKISNFMQRADTGALVFNDVVFDVEDFNKRTYVH